MPAAAYQSQDQTDPARQIIGLWGPPGPDNRGMEAPEGWHECTVRVRYGEVDRMGVVYHGHYLVYFEQGRTEYLRSLGATYREVEDSGTLLIVVDTALKFHRPAHYDDELRVLTRLASARGVRLRFEYEVRRGEDLLTTGHTILACADASGRPCRPPTGLRALIAPPANAERKTGAPADVQGVDVQGGA